MWHFAVGWWRLRRSARPEPVGGDDSGGSAVEAARIRGRIAVVGAVLVMGAASSSAMGAVAEPLRVRTAVVIGWEPGSKSNVVVKTTGRVYVIKSLRRYSVGSRVRIRGIKWGTVGSGIKWGVRPLGVKWGIRMALNGTYRSGFTVLGRQRSMALRGIVLRRWDRRVAIAYRGAVVFLPVARGAVWLPGGKILNAGALGERGSRVEFRVGFPAGGGAIVTRATQIAPPVPNAAIPFGGTLTSVDAGTGTIVVSATRETAYPLELTLTFPESMDVANFVVGDHVAGRMVPSAVGPEIYVTALSRDTTFAQADDPATSQTAPPPDPKELAAIAELRAAWDAGEAGGKFTQQGTGLFTSQQQQLRLVATAIGRSQDGQLILKKLDAFIAAVQDATPIGAPQPSPPEQIDPTFQAQIVVQAQALRLQILG